MRIYIILLAIAFFSCNEKKQKDYHISIRPGANIKPEYDTPVFHVKVKSFSCTHWVVVFTNDDFITEYPVTEAFDITGDYLPIRVELQENLFRKKEDAILFAKKFKSFEYCLKYNENMRVRYDSLLAYRKRHAPTKEQPDIFLCNKDPEEIIVR